MATSYRAKLAMRARGAGPAKRVAAALLPRACAIVGALAGFLAGWFGLAAGFIIGFMLDVARLESRSRRLLSRYMRGPNESAEGEPISRGLRESLPGCVAATCLALRGEWPGVADPGARRILWNRLSSAVLPSDRRLKREADRVADAATRCAGADLPSLARLLATSDSYRARKLLADWAFAVAALGRCRLDAGTELGLRAALGDCGVGSREILAARLAFFSGERDPWTVLGLAPGASRAEVKRSYRRLSRAFHPDALPGSDGERFREVCEAYALLGDDATR
jgi:DnaJ domain